MTDKQEKIMDSALRLFAEEGFNGVSTSRIAKEAGVSEGLIFRHFKSKVGLLEAIVQQAEDRMVQVMWPVMLATDPRSVIRRFIQNPFRIDQSEYDFWKLVFMLKWNPAFKKGDIMQPLMDKLSSALKDLGYAEPEEEARVLNHIMSSISTYILQEGKEKYEDLELFLCKKYNV